MLRPIVDKARRLFFAGVFRRDIVYALVALAALVFLAPSRINHIIRPNSLLLI